MKNLGNSVQLIGRLGQDPESRTLSNGRMLTTFSLATSESYTNSAGEKVKETQWHNIVAWGRKAEIAAEYLKKGKEVALEGRLVHRKFEAGNGEKRSITQINMNELLMVGRNSGRKAV